MSFSTGTLLPRLPSEPGMTLLTLKIEKIGLKDAGQCIEPYMTISVRGITAIFFIILLILVVYMKSVGGKKIHRVCLYRRRWRRFKPCSGHSGVNTQRRYIHSFQRRCGNPETS